MTSERQVVLLDESLAPIGSASRDEVHTESTPLHLAFSCYLLNPDGLVLITRRSLAKRTWPGVWTNSFCGHPQPGEDIEDAVRRHARDELGVGLDTLSVTLADFRYRAVDANGIVENEFCPVFTATTSDEVHPNPLEVAEHGWVSLGDLADTARALPHLLSPWSVLQLAQLAKQMSPSS